MNRSVVSRGHSHYLESPRDPMGPTVMPGMGQVKSKFAKGRLDQVANVASLARRSRAHFNRVREVSRRIHEDGIVTPLERAEFEEVMQEHEVFELASVTSHELRQATERATDPEQLGEKWGIHVAVISQLPVVPLNA